MLRASLTGIGCSSVGRRWMQKVAIMLNSALDMFFRSKCFVVMVGYVEGCLLCSARHAMHFCILFVHCVLRRWLFSFFFFLFSFFLFFLSLRGPEACQHGWVGGDRPGAEQQQIWMAS